jgi:hypothetical protein
MTGRAYSRLTTPREICYDATTPAPASYLAALLDASLNHGIPARRPLGQMWSWAGRRGLPTSTLTVLLRLLPRRESPRTDALLQRVGAAWSTFAHEGRRLPRHAPELHALEVQRSAARTTFVFGEGTFPLLVLKEPHSGHSGTSLEVAVLKGVRALDIGPRVLGDFPDFALQEGLPGLPLKVLPVRRSNAGRLQWRKDCDQLVVALSRLAVASARRSQAPGGLLNNMEKACEYPLISPLRDLVNAARRDLQGLGISVVQHRDLSPQNWLVDDGRFAGLVDWELAVLDGVPGFDALHAAVALFEHGVGLHRWSGLEVTTCFEIAWQSAPLFVGARMAMRETARAAGVEEHLMDSLEIAYFARRLGRSLSSDVYHLHPSTLARMLSVVCG